MATSRLVPPSPLSMDGNIAENFKKWKQKFELYMLASESNKKAPEVQVEILLHVIGPDAQSYVNRLL